MNMQELEGMKVFLLEQKGQVLNKTSEFKTTTLQHENLADEAEVASQDLSMNLCLHLHERDRLLLLKIEQALSKIEEGTFGLCDSCGCEINAKRLQARPFANLCIECKEEQEEENRSFQQF